MSTGNTTLCRASGHWRGSFVAMACPCELLVEDCDEAVAQQLLTLASRCAWRIEHKFSRYRADSIVHGLNTSAGRPVDVDAETAALIDFGATLSKLSDGAFDLTSGVLRRAWTFDGGEHAPDAGQIEELMRRVGWSRVMWNRPVLQMQSGMELDFGGIGKEYAVDATADTLRNARPTVSCLVNFGGDLAVTTARRDGQPWLVGIEGSDQPGVAITTIPLLRGALATSGDSRRFVRHEGRRYSHILDARTGWPVTGAPRSVTVLAPTCSEAGSLATLASLKGAEAETYLGGQGVTFWLQN